MILAKCVEDVLCDIDAVEIIPAESKIFHES
jgi:hypothetical protein